MGCLATGLLAQYASMPGAKPVGFEASTQIISKNDLGFIRNSNLGLVVYRQPWQEPPRLRLLKIQSPKAAMEPTPLLRLMRSHFPAVPEERTPVGGSPRAGGAGPAPREPKWEYAGLDELHLFARACGSRGQWTAYALAVLSFARLLRMGEASPLRRVDSHARGLRFRAVKCDP